MNPFQLLSKLNEPNLGYGLIFLIGFLASFHCVGMCGGFVASYSLRRDEKTKSWDASRPLPHLQYNLARLLSYTLIGVILGGFGSFFAVSPVFTGIITILAGAMMIIVGLSLFSNSKLLKKIQPGLPLFVARYLYGLEKSNRKPVFIGLLNGLMPCGPLQAMQLYALSSGSPIKGGLSMGFYALGTIPLMFSFGNLISLVSREKTGALMKYAGIIVVLLGVLTFNRGLGNFKINLPGFWRVGNTASDSSVGKNNEYQEARMSLTARGYEPNTLYVKVGIPVKWVIGVKQMSGCTNEIILQGYNIRKKLAYGENVIEFTPKKVGEINFSCWMQMVWGKFVVTN